MLRGSTPQETSAWLLEVGSKLSARAGQLSRGGPSKGPHKNKKKRRARMTEDPHREARARSGLLSTSADTVGVSFAGREFQQLYFEAR